MGDGNTLQYNHTLEGQNEGMFLLVSSKLI